MEQYRWRKWARTVAYVDLILTSLSLLVVVLGAVSFGMGMANNEGVDDDTEVEDPWTGKRPKAGNFPEDFMPELIKNQGFLWATFVTGAILKGLQLWAALKLLKGTELGREPGEAHGLCDTWRKVCIGFLVLEVIVYGLSQFVISLALMLCMRGTFIYIVSELMKELKNSIPDPVGVTVK